MINTEVCLVTEEQQVLCFSTVLKFRTVRIVVVDKQLFKNIICALSLLLDPR